MSFQIIVCVNKKKCIGKDNGLLCYLPSDLKNFKKLTTNNVVVMGRKTFQSLPSGALPNRENIVITHDLDFNAPNVISIHSVEECVSYCKENLSEKEIFIIGGGSIYAEFLERGMVDKINMTISDNLMDGDVYFPTLNEDEWVKKECEREFFDERDECDYKIFTYERK